MVEKSDLSSLDLRVLETLTQSKRTAGTVRLASDMWQGDDFTMGADPVGLVQSIVEHLCELGLVTFRMHGTGSFSDVVWSDFPEPPNYKGLATDVRLTQDGWQLMGFPLQYYQVGTHLATSMRLDAKGDRTNFRKHDTRAEGGAIEIDDFPTHRANYPHHVHMYEDNDMPRQYTKVTDAIEGTVLGYKSRFPLADYAAIADETGIPERTVRYILTELPRLRRMSDGQNGEQTQKQRILVALEQLDFKDVPNLIRTLGRGDSAHDIVHALHDLKKQGMVEFDERGTSTKEPKNIRLSARGRKSANLSPTPERQVLVGATDEEQRARLSPALDIDRPFDTVEIRRIPEPKIPVYPLLTALIDREQERARFDQKALNYLAAADVIRDTDAETAALLEEKARQSDIPFPSPLEAEYLSFWRNSGLPAKERE